MIGCPDRVGGDDRHSAGSVDYRWTSMCVIEMFWEYISDELGPVWSCYISWIDSKKETQMLGDSMMVLLRKKGNVIKILGIKSLLYSFVYNVSTTQGDMTSYKRRLISLWRTVMLSVYDSLRDVSTLFLHPDLLRKLFWIKLCLHKKKRPLSAVHLLAAFSKSYSETAKETLKNSAADKASSRSCVNADTKGKRWIAIELNYQACRTQKRLVMEWSRLESLRLNWEPGSKGELELIKRK